MNIALLIHGLKDSRATGLLRLAPYLEGKGYRVYPITYGWFFLRGFLWAPFNKPLARLVATFTKILDDAGHEVVALAHSNGATIAVEASKLGAPFRVLTLINGAVERDAVIGDRTGFVLNLRVASDPVLALSRVIAPLTPWADFDGSLGSSGFKPMPSGGWKQNDFNLTEKFGIKGHSGFMSEDMIPITGPWLTDRIIEHHAMFNGLTRTP